MKAFRELFSSLYPGEEHIAIAEARRAEYCIFYNNVVFLQLAFGVFGGICGLIGLTLLLFSLLPRASDSDFYVSAGEIILPSSILGACSLGLILIDRRKHKLWSAVAWKKLKKFDAAWVNLEVAFFGREDVIENITTAERLRKLIELETRKAAIKIHRGPVNHLPTLGIDPMAAERTMLRGLESLAASLKLFGLADEMSVMSDERDPDCHDDFVKMIDLLLCQEVVALAGTP